MAMKRQSLRIRKRDPNRREMAKEESLASGGNLKVPCLKIVDEQGGQTWTYESSDIIAYLETRFAVEKLAAV